MAGRTHREMGFVKIDTQEKWLSGDRICMTLQPFDRLTDADFGLRQWQGYVCSA